MVDVDCHAATDPRAARIECADFLAKLEAHLGIELYCNASTNGAGIHGFFLLNRQGRSNEQANDALTQAESFAMRLLRSQNYRHITGVEFRGKLPLVQWGYRRTVEHYTAGDLFAAPVVLGREEEFLATIDVGLSVRDLVRLADVEIEEAEIVQGQGEEEPLGTLPLSGRSTGCPISRKDSNWQKFMPIAAQWGPLRASQNRIVKHEHIAVALMILHYCGHNPNEGNALPQARIEGLWHSTRAAGYHDLPWCHNRWAAIKSYLSTHGWLTWVDSGYIAGAVIEGKFVKGRCQRWAPSEALLCLLAGEEIVDSQGEVVWEAGEEEPLRPVPISNPLPPWNDPLAALLPGEDHPPQRKFFGLISQYPHLIQTSAA
ncbi:hypothetical protein, partial [Tautonia marina]|uniref:hypothetical protein n=1 Tax=Tautonia marina TaxID=2653855 RepID=UPI001260B7A0